MDELRMSGHYSPFAGHCHFSSLMVSLLNHLSWSLPKPRSLTSFDKLRMSGVLGRRAE